MSARTRLFAQQYPGRRAGARVQPAGHAGRAHPRRRRRHPRLLHQDRRRHRWSPRARKSREFDGETYVMETRPRRRPRHRQGLEGRHRGQPRLPQDRAQLQSDDGDGRQGHGRRGRAAGASPARLDPDHIHTPGIFVKRIVARAAMPRSASSSAPSRKRAATEGRIDEWPGPVTRWRPAPRRNCATASTSISASASRRWWPTTSPTASNVHAAERERHARHGPVPLSRARRMPT